MSIWRRIYRAFRVHILREPAWMHETLEEVIAWHEEYFSRPEVIERMRAIPPSFTWSRSTGELTRIERD